MSAPGCPCGSGKPFAECHGDRPPVEGWKDIADALGVSVWTAHQYATRAEMPLVVYYDHRDRVWCPWSHIRDFKNQHHLPAWAHALLRQRGLLPHQRSAAMPRRRHRPTNDDAQAVEAEADPADEPEERQGAA